VGREYFSIIFNVKKCALYSIKYGSSKKLFLEELKKIFLLTQTANHFGIEMLVAVPWRGPKI
jgi:hypothetical protein